MAAKTKDRSWPFLAGLAAIGVIWLGCQSQALVPVQEVKPVLPQNQIASSPPPAPPAAPAPPAGLFIIDLHADTLTRLFETHDLGMFAGHELEVTLPGLQAGGVKGQFFAAWVPPGQGFAHAETLIKIYRQLLEKYSASLAPARSAQEFEANLRAGKISAFLGVEGGHCIGTDLGKVDILFREGVRYMTLTWNNSNAIADAAKDHNKPNHGLSPFGETVVRRMNELGMIVDISHTSEETVADVLKASREPIIASHSCCYALMPHFRNLKDDQIRAICARGGVIGINFNSPFLSTHHPAALADVANHIDHAVKIGGIGCVALGSDYDGRIEAPRGLENSGRLGNLTQELKRRGYTEADLEQIYWRNFLRLLRQAVDAKLR